MIQENPFDKITELRESGKYKEAYDLINQLLWKLAEKKDYKNLSSAYGHRSYVWKHLSKIKDQEHYSHLAMKEAEIQLMLVEKFKEGNLHTALFILGKLKLLPGQYKEAAALIKQSLRIYKGTKAEKADWKNHYGFALYKSGDQKRGSSQMKQSIIDLMKYKNEVPSFEYNVWLSGAYMRLAEALHKHDRKKAKEYKQKAGEIVQSDPRLIVRKKQLKRV